MPNFKEINQYLVPQSSKNLPKLSIPKFSITIFGRSKQLTKMKMVSLNSHWKTESLDSNFSRLNNQLQNLTWFDLTLTWSRPKNYLNQLTKWVPLLNFMGNMTHKTCVASRNYPVQQMTFGDLTWSWPWPLHSVLSTAPRLTNLWTRSGWIRVAPISAAPVGLGSQQCGNL